MEENKSVNVRELEPTSSEVKIICDKLDALQKLIIIHNRTFPTWATATLGVMIIAHVITMGTLIWVIQHLGQLPAKSNSDRMNFHGQGQNRTAEIACDRTPSS